MAELLGEVLFRMGAVRPTDVARGLRTQQQQGGRLGEVLVRLGIIDEDTLIAALAQQRRIPMADARSIDASDPAVVPLVPGWLAWQWRLMPLRMMESILLVATCDADNVARLEEFARTLGRPLAVVLARRVDVERALARSYGTPLAPLGVTPVPPPVAAVQAPAVAQPILLTRRKDPPLIAAERDVELRDLFAPKDSRPVEKAPSVEKPRPRTPARSGSKSTSRPAVKPLSSPGARPLKSPPRFADIPTDPGGDTLATQAFDEAVPTSEDVPKVAPVPKVAVRIPGEGEVFGSYKLIKRLTVGGMAELFLARTSGAEGFEKQVAIKRILPALCEDDDFVKRFIEEAKLTVQLTHANIAHIYELGREAGLFFIAMEYVHGRDVDGIVEQATLAREWLPLSVCCHIAQQACEGLDYAHRKKGSDGRPLGIVHRDVSPSNILVSYEGAVKVIDFGIAKAASSMNLTQPGAVMGKLSYMSPEQVHGVPLDRRTDIFAFGVVMWELLAQRRLFKGPTDIDTIKNVLRGEIPPLLKQRQDVPKALAAIVHRCLQRDVDKRYQWCSEISADLKSLIVEHKMHNGPNDTSEHLVRKLPPKV